MQGSETMDNRVAYLVSCVGKKRSLPSPAKDLYVSAWFLKARHYVEATGCPWFILSAAHGLIEPDQVIAPYEKTLNLMPVHERREWAAKVAMQVRESIPATKHVVIFAGQRYREFLEDHFKADGIAMDVPLKGLRIGEQLSWLSTHSSL